MTRSAPAAAMVNLLGDLWSEGEPDWTDVLARRRTPTSTCTARRSPVPAGRWAT